MRPGGFPCILIPDNLQFFLTNTPSERVAYGLELEQIERLKAKDRQGERTDLTSASTDAKGMSEPSYRRAKRVVESGNQETIEKLQ